MADPVFRVLFVCMGHICRSPAAEGVMRRLAERSGAEARWQISSAGTIGMHAGEASDARMRAAAARRGYDLRSRARQVAATDLDAYDLILTMDEANRRAVLALARTDAQRARVRPFVAYCRQHDVEEVPDPYYGGADGFERVLDLLEDGCSALLAESRSEK